MQASGSSRATATISHLDFPLRRRQCRRCPHAHFLIDGEAIVTNGNGLAVFDLIRRKRNGGAAVLIAYDLIKLMSHSINVLA